MNKAFLSIYYKSKIDDNITEQLEQWRELGLQKFNECIIHDTYQEFAFIVPIKESMVQNNPDLHITISNSKFKGI